MKRVLIAAVLAVGVGGIAYFALTRKQQISPSPAAPTPAPSLQQGQPVANEPLKAVPPQPVAAISAKPEDVAKIKVLNEILVSKNDNDPRLDRDFNALTSGSKALMRARYSEILPEKRNERGTIVFLLGRNLATNEDLEFLAQVLGEPPCLSMENCQKESGHPDSSEDHHHDIGVEVSLAYPQIVALKSLESYIFGSKQDPALLAAAIRKLQAARGSNVPKVSELANQIYKRYESRGNGNGSF